MSDKVKGLNTGVWLSEMWQRLIPWAKAFEADDACRQMANDHVGDSRFSSGETDISASNIWPGVFFVDLKSDLQKKMYCEVSCDEKERNCSVKLKETLQLPVVYNLSYAPDLSGWNLLLLPFVPLSLLGGCSVIGPAIQDTASQSEDFVEEDVDITQTEIGYDGDLREGDVDLKSLDANANGADDVIEEIDAAIAELDAAKDDSTSGDVAAEDQTDSGSMVFDPIAEITFSDQANSPAAQADACGFDEMPTMWQIMHVKQDDVTYNAQTGGIPPSVFINEPDVGVSTSILLYSEKSGFSTCNMDHSVEPVGIRWTLSGGSCFDGYEKMTMLGIYYSVNGADAVYLELEGAWQVGSTTCMSTFSEIYQD